MRNAMNSGFLASYLPPEGGGPAMVHMSRPDIYGGAEFGGGGGFAAPSYSPPPAPPFAPSFAPSAPPMMGGMGMYRPRFRGMGMTAFDEPQRGPVNFMAQQFGAPRRSNSAYGAFSGLNPFGGGFNPYDRMF